MFASQARKGFTLIELLVVIAIIAILAAILFPVFAQAKSAAKHTQNLSNIKQLALSALMYSNDYDDTFVYTAWVWDVPGGRTEEFHHLFQPYVKNWGIMYDPNRTNNCSTYGNTWGDSPRCKGYGANTGIMGWGNGTGMFAELVNVTVNGTLVQLYAGRSLTSYPTPADMVMLNTTADEPMYSTDFTWQRYEGAPGVGTFLKHPRNDGKWVRAFVDGHAKTVFYDAYKAPGYAYLVMPKARIDMERMCFTLDTASYGGFTCGSYIDWLLANRTAY